jgi:FkbM family methyltransferase
VFLDVGANAGVFSLVASRLVGRGGRVFSFEPSVREYQRLCDAVSLNGLNAMVTPLKTAVGAKTGQELLRVASEPHSGLNTLGSEFPYEDVAVWRLEQVQVTTLDEFARDESLPRIDVIKIDIEGAEAKALAGASETLVRYRPILIVEVFSRSLALNGSSVADVERRLRDARYRLFRIDDETAELLPISELAAIDEQNIVAVPAEAEP